MKTFSIFTVRKMSNGKIEKKHMASINAYSHRAAKYAYVAETGYGGQIVTREFKPSTAQPISKILVASLKIQERIKLEQLAIENAAIASRAASSAPSLL